MILPSLTKAWTGDCVLFETSSQHPKNIDQKVLRSKAYTEGFQGISADFEFSSFSPFQVRKLLTPPQSFVSLEEQLRGITVMKKKLSNLVHVFVPATALLLTACTTNHTSFDKPVVNNVKSQAVAQTPGTPSNIHRSADGSATTEVDVQITLDKSAILGREFLYGADLQYSDYHDPGMDLNNQSMSIGHIPVTFRIVGNELQIIADNKRLSASDVDHPELLISRYPIISQNDASVVVGAANSRVFLGEVFQGTINGADGTLYSPTGKAPRDSWVRSFDYVANGNYLLQQTSIITADGNIAEFMESLMPRTTLSPGSDFMKLPMNPDADRITSANPDADFLNRFRFLAGETIFQGAAAQAGQELPEPKSIAYGQHFDLSNNATIDWYVTANAPDNVLPALKNAVEGWNRYFRSYQGFKRDVVLFKGRLPDGIHIGDPRYNVINWDSKRIAGAAYESQASDPDTGKQSHSLIYMPAAWLQIGDDYWKFGQTSDASSNSASASSNSASPSAGTNNSGANNSASNSNATNKKIGRASKKPSDSRMACGRAIEDAGLLATSGRLNKEEIQNFATQLLKQTLFHEVGHALGFAHNFKGSLSFDRSKPDSMFSTSIMDYNDYEIERAAFYATDSSDGPLLEYDREFLSALYDQSHDIDKKSAAVPACADAEADNEAGGVDPICIRYDIEHDPTLSVNTAIDRVNLATKDRDITLSQALSNIPALALKDSDVQSAKVQADAEALADRLGSALVKPLNFYYFTGKASVTKTVKTNVKSLLEFSKDDELTGYDPTEMRSRAFEGVQKSLGMIDLSDEAKKTLTAAQEAGVQLIAGSPYLKGLSDKDRATEMDKLRGKVKDAVASFVTGDVVSVSSTGDVASLATMRAQVLATLARHSAVPFALTGTDAKSAVDYEKDIIGILVNSIGKNPKRTQDERVAAATALMTFKNRVDGDPAIEAATKQITDERAKSFVNADRENAQALLDILNGKASSSSDS
jgi:hypothetical protein